MQRGQKRGVTPERGAEIPDSKEAKGKKEGLADVVEKVKKDIAQKGADAIKQARRMFGALSKRAQTVDLPQVDKTAAQSEIDYVNLIQDLQVSMATSADLARVGPPSPEAQSHLPGNFDEKYKWLLSHSNGNEWTYKAWIATLEKFADMSPEDRGREIVMTPDLKDFRDWPSEHIMLLLDSVRYEVRPSFDDLGGDVPDEEIDAKIVELTQHTNLPHTYDYERYAIGGDKPAKLQEKFPEWGRKDFKKLCEKFEERRRKGIEEANRRYEERQKQNE